MNELRIVTPTRLREIAKMIEYASTTSILDLQLAIEDIRILADRMEGMHASGGVEGSISFGGQ
jgi:hypothetical protein